VEAIRGLLVVLAAGGWVVSASKLRNLRRDPSNLGLASGIHTTTPAAIADRSYDGR
jgi:glycerol-3-phosphate dehydrogenase